MSLGLFQRAASRYLYTFEFDLRELPMSADIVFIKWQRKKKKGTTGLFPAKPDGRFSRQCQVPDKISLAATLFHKRGNSRKFHEKKFKFKVLQATIGGEVEKHAVGSFVIDLAKFASYESQQRRVIPLRGKAYATVSIYTRLLSAAEPQWTPSESDVSLKSNISCASIDVATCASFDLSDDELDGDLAALQSRAATQSEWFDSHKYGDYAEEISPEHSFSPPPDLAPISEEQDSVPEDTRLKDETTETLHPEEEQMIEESEAENCSSQGEHLVAGSAVSCCHAADISCNAPSAEETPDERTTTGNPDAFAIPTSQQAHDITLSRTDIAETRLLLEDTQREEAREKDPEDESPRIGSCTTGSTLDSASSCAKPQNAAERHTHEFINNVVPLPLLEGTEVSPLQAKSSTKVHEQHSPYAADVESLGNRSSASDSAVASATIAPHLRSWRGERNQQAREDASDLPRYTPPHEKTRPGILQRGSCTESNGVVKSGASASATRAAPFAPHRPPSTLGAWSSIARAFAWFSTANDEKEHQRILSLENQYGCIRCSACGTFVSMELLEDHSAVCFA